ncbi:hypothetical protein C6X66_03595 [Escherichia coli]|nr:hypothetical protein C6X66_03595 [Escherichia coli]PTO14348.1 hypothetical protein DAT31_06430 [Escherichia coli]
MTPFTKLNIKCGQQYLLLPKHKNFHVRLFLRNAKEGANKRGNTSRLTQSFHFFMFEPIFSPVNALNQPI